jgi:hypothetical protein
MRDNILGVIAVVTFSGAIIFGADGRGSPD